MLKNLLDACGAGLGFYTVGFALAYGENGTTKPTFAGGSNFFLSEGVDSSF